MPRPSNKLERREEILDAYERCIVRYGVAGATLQRVADESGLARPLLRHHVGNREELLQELLYRLDTRFKEERSSLIQYLPESKRCAAMLDLLFDPRYVSKGHDVLLQQALMFAAEEHPQLKVSLVRWHDVLIQDIETELQVEHPEADVKTLRAVATGITALYLNAESMTSMTDAKALFVDSKLAAQRLLEVLSWNG